MKAPRILLAVLAIGCTGALALAATYTYWGAGPDDDWDTCKNWILVGIGTCSPSTTSDDATIPSAGSTWSINLVTAEMDDLTIAGSVDFASPGSTQTLTVNSLTIDGSGGEVVITIDGVILETAP
ncbi:MAG: hypothetical protein KKB50_03325 [Planctomycetes bacterium]|nr:hypothetical protein [Planctomycetota bacterium]